MERPIGMPIKCRQFDMTIKSKKKSQIAQLQQQVKELQEELKLTQRKFQTTKTSQSQEQVDHDEGFSRVFGI